MAFSFRKIISNISYFKKEEGSVENPNESSQKDAFSSLPIETAEIVSIDSTEPDSTSLKLPESLKNFTTKKGSFSDTDLLTTITTGIAKKEKKEKRQSKKLKIDIPKAYVSEEPFQNENIENTPKQLLLNQKKVELFSENLKKFNFSQSFDLFDEMSDEETKPYEKEIESLSSDSEVSTEDDDVKMCRKVELSSKDLPGQHNQQIVRAFSLESFGDVDIDRNEEERLHLLLNYQTKLEGFESYLKKLFTEFQFHIEVSKMLQCRSVTPMTGVKNNVPNPNMIDTYRGVSPTDSWNIVLEKEDEVNKLKLEQQLQSIINIIQEFINQHLKKTTVKHIINKKAITFKHQVKNRANKKRIRHFDFPDYRDAFLSLFCNELHEDGITSIDADHEKCNCNCHGHSTSESDSGLTTKSTERSMSITSSIGNFTLDSSTLTAYSESLDQIISYNSFQDTSLYSTLLQKVAIERITFYVQVHSIQIKVETSEEFESKNIITFHCPACLMTEYDEHGLLKHILSQYHCEKIHFLYKTAYIKKCMQSGKEIQPSTVLNPMTMYRDDNKIVCFGDAMYACSLCFENLIIGESVLMKHCNVEEHIDRREKLGEIFE